MADSSNLFFPLVATGTAVAVGSIALLQTDMISRKILDPAQLCSKRRSEYRYNWKKAVEKNKLLMDYCLAGGPQKYDEDPEIVLKGTEYVSKEDDLDALINKILDKKSSDSKFLALKIDRDPHDPTDEFYLFMVEEQESRNNKVLLQVPLVSFGEKLSQAFEDQLTTTTLCFVADASSGKATGMLEKLVKEFKSGVAVVSEPFWMVQMARLAEASIFASSRIRKLVFALCRLDAWSVRHELGNAKTVLFTLPGQATVATLLPLVQGAFPEDRHVFAYDGCVASVKRGIYAESMHKASKLVPNLEPILQGMCQDPVRITYPLPSNSPLSHSVSLGGKGGRMEKAFARLPVQQARIVETWISSVDAYFRLKEDEATNGYVPYCIKVGFLTDDPVGNFEYGTDSYWSLNSLMQYVTGSKGRGRAVNEEMMDAAKEWVKDYNQARQAEETRMEQQGVLSEHNRKMIEDCCFQHKQILIGNKTLQDTCLPKEHWTLKQASRNGCSCCGPDPYDLMNEEEAEGSNPDREMRSGGFGLDKFAKVNATNGPLVKNFGVQNRYVDATQVFAFDPSRFSR